MPQYLSPGVYVEEVEAGSRPIEGVATSVAAFVGMAKAGPVNRPTLVTNWTQFTQTFGDHMEGSYLAHAVYGYFNNGGGSAYVVRIGAPDDDDADTPQLVPATSALPTAADGDQLGYEVSAKEAGPEGNGLRVEVQEASEPGDDGSAFKIVVKRGDQELESFDNLTTGRGRQNVATHVNANSQLIEMTETSVKGSIERRPATGASVELAGGGEAAPLPAQLDAADYVGDAADRTGFAGLEAIEDITMLMVPDLMAAYQQRLIDLEGVQAVQLAMIAHAELMGDRLAILDPPPALNAQQVKEWRVDKAGYDSKQAALYWPWVKVFDPASGQNQFVPPCGHMAGIWARSDATRGVHKAPANEVVRGAIALETNITRSEHDGLNPNGVNVIRSFPGMGIRVWGARTLSSDPAWRYINVRRLFNYLEESIMGGTQWVVFEPNDYDLWQRIRRTIAAFLVRQWRDGALFGQTPADAFYVKCDDETNPSEMIDAGQVTCEIGVAPVKPAEFVVFRLAQFSGGTSISE
ncbi:MAG: phage tail sheath subtilisin-like domain-containing protein [Ilumatobacter fluminis]|uniref:phage tail sheath family protein n=1 Tax=Ilumatobacter fluminis TaxID=467091 RepID=UPI0032EAFBBB